MILSKLSRSKPYSLINAFTETQHFHMSKHLAKSVTYINETQLCTYKEKNREAQSIIRNPPAV